MALLILMFVKYPLTSRTYDKNCNIYFFKYFGQSIQLARILVPQPRIESVPPAAEVQSPDHCIAREFP